MNRGIGSRAVARLLGVFRWRPQGYATTMRRKRDAPRRQDGSLEWRTLVVAIFPDLATALESVRVLSPTIYDYG
jgi:hypothetical protein